MSKSFGLGRPWYAILENPKKQLTETIVHVMSNGGSREIWQRIDEKQDIRLLAWPKETAFRVGVIVQGAPKKELRPATAFPFLEGLPNDMTVQEYQAWPSKVEGTVAACRNEGANPIRFYTPLLFRDVEALTEGVRHTFVLAGLALGIRKALLDHVDISSGPNYEKYAEQWLAAHPGKSRLDVPQLTLPLRGSRILMPNEYDCEYQFRAPISAVDNLEVAGEKIYVLTLEFGLDSDNPLRIAVYAPERICKDEPKAGMEIDGLIWLQGRIMDFDLDNSPLE